MKIRTIFSAIAALLLAISCGGKEGPAIKPPIVNPGGGDDPEDPGQTGGVTLPKVGDEITPWVEGCFDIHFINTQMGECTFLIFPDGTQMLIDAAGSLLETRDGSAPNIGIRKRWDPTKDSSFNCNKFIENYLRKCMAWTGNDCLDYALVTHLHNDHYGAHLGQPVSPNSPTFKQQSMVYIMDNFKIGKLMDRAYPDYNYPFDMSKVYKPTDDHSVCNWMTAVKWHVANKGLKVEKVQAGSGTQVAAVRNPSKYSSFKVRVIGVNGEVWTGSGDATVKTFPPLEKITCANPPSVVNTDNCPEENHESAVLKFTYGMFDYWAGGDMQFDGMSTYPWKDIELPMAKACGEVDVMKADHHGSSSTNGYTSKTNAMKYLNPKCWIVCGWTDIHPRQATFEGVTNLLPDLDAFICNTCDSQKAYANFNKAVKGSDGHIVVRVMNNGSKYYVYTLTDSDEKMTVKRIAGPYSSR